MTPAVLLERLKQKGVTVQVEGDALRIRPASALTPEEIESLRCLKTKILDLAGSPPVRSSAATPRGWPESLSGSTKTVGPFNACIVCAARTWVSYASIPLCLGCAGGRGATLVAYREALRRFWLLVADHAADDHAAQAEVERLIDDVGVPLADRLRRAWWREWHEETGFCPWCGDRSVFHDPKTGEP